MISAIVLGGVVWVLLLALLSQTVSALVKWRVVASGALLGIFFIPTVFGAFINEVFRDTVGKYHQPGRDDQERNRRSVWNVRARRWHDVI